MKPKWQIWIDDCLATNSKKNYMEDVCDDIISQRQANITEVNEYLLSIGQEPNFA